MQYTLDGETFYEGQPTIYRWNGWHCPLFSESVARRIIQDTGASPDTLTAARVGDLYAVGAFEWVWYPAVS